MKNKKTVQNKKILSAKKNNKPIAWLSGNFFNSRYILPAILGIVFLLYLRVFLNDITTRDDVDYILKNPFISSLKPDNIVAIFSNYFMGNYHPLSMLCYAIGYQIGGFNAWPYQLINLALHLLNTALVFVFIKELIGKSTNPIPNAGIIAPLTALLFGISAINVESVAWLSENKNVLYTCFFLMSLIQYIRFIHSNSWKNFAFAILFFSLSLFSKGMAVSLSISLIAIDIFFRRKIFSGRVILEKIPFLSLSVLFGIIALYAQKSASAIYLVNNSGKLEIFEKISIASYGLVNYILKIIVPFGLTASYEYPLRTAEGFSFPASFYLYPIVLIILSIIFYKRIRKDSVLLFGTLFFLINIFLVLQLIPVGGAMMAERYAYVPSIGYLFIVAYLVASLVNKYGNKMYTILAIYLLVMSVVTFQRIGVWKDSLTLWDDILEKGNKKPHSAAWWARAGIYNSEGKYQKALESINVFIESYPDFGDAYFRRAYSKMSLNDFQGALLDLNLAEKLVLTKYPEIYNNRGSVNNKLGRFQDAVLDFNKVLELNDTSVSALNGRSDAKIGLGEYDGALKDLHQSIAINPNNPEVYNNLGIVYTKTGDYTNAFQTFSKAINLQPDFILAYQNRVDCCFVLGEYKVAVADLTYIISKYQIPIAYYFRGKAYMYQNMSDNACDDFIKSSDLGYPLEEEIKKYCNLN